MKAKRISSPSLKEQNYLPARFVLAFMAFLGMISNLMLRSNINMAIVAMVQPRNSSNSSDIENNECGFISNETVVTDDYDGEFDWDEFTQSLIIGSFYWGYIWTQIPGGRLAEIFGAKSVFGGAIAGASLLTLLIPTMARWSYSALIAIRILLGLSEGATFPSTHALLSCWAPPNERSVFAGVVYAGSPAGTVTSYIFTAFLLDTFGWESVFYVQAGVSLVWVILWFILVSDHPDNSRWISEAEKLYIVESIGESKNIKPPPVPWKKVFTSLPFWAIFIAGFGSAWGLNTLMTDLPLYMKEMLKTDIHANAIYSSMPYLGKWAFSIISSIVADTVRSNNILSTGAVRKIANSIAHGGPAVCLICLQFVECKKSATIVLLFITVTLQGGVYSGFAVNHIDIAPNYAGTLFGITNMVATIPGWLAPMTVGALTNNQQTLAQWRKVFYLAAALYLTDALFYVLFASGSEQSWNHFPKSDEGSPQADAGRIRSVSDSLKYNRSEHQDDHSLAYDSYVVDPNFREVYHKRETAQK